MNHTGPCRKRIEEKLREAGDPRIDAADKRLTDEMARRLAAQDAAAAPGGVVPGGDECTVSGADGNPAPVDDEPFSAGTQANNRERKDVRLPQSVSETERREREIEAERRERDFNGPRINPEPEGRPRRHEAHDGGNM